MRSAVSAARWLPKEYVESSSAGGVFTVVAYVFMAIVFFLELKSFMVSTYSTYLTLDRKDSQFLQVNFDLDVYDIECRNLRIIVRDHFGEEPFKATARDFMLRPIDARGQAYGVAFRPDESPEEKTGGEDETAKKHKELERQDGKAELDADWSSSHDGFGHKSFEHVIQYHDFTFINFFATWCSHCRDFSPKWGLLADKINGKTGEPQKFRDRDNQMREVRMIKMNCVDYQELCNEKGVDAYPMLRLYKGDGTFSVFEGHRDETEIVRWLERTVKMKSYGWAKHHEAFERGCNAKGLISVPRVPGQFEILAGAGDQDLNPSMTNVSHYVRHLSFSDPDDGKYHRRAWAGLSHAMFSHVSPMDGRTLVTKNPHEAWQHYLKVVGTVTHQGQTAYQFQPHSRLATLGQDEVPQSMFHYDIEPFSIWLKRDSKRWYDFLTSTMAVLGGTLVVMRLMSVSSQAAIGGVSKALAASGSNSMARRQGYLDGGFHD